MRFRIPPEDQQAAVEQVFGAAGPYRTYFVLTLLSTIIASYGLISDATATVIGAMIVAPLMGPILGLAMGAVREDSKLTTTSLLAEAAGLATAGAVGLLVSPSSGRPGTRRGPPERTRHRPALRRHGALLLTVGASSPIS